MTSPEELRAPGDRKHLERLLTEWARDPDIGAVVTAGRLRHLVGVVAIAAILGGLRGEDGVERIGFKGGSSLELRFGFKARSSRDLDAAYRGELQEGIRSIRTALEQGWNGFAGSITEPEDIVRAGVHPPPVRTKIKLRYKGRDFITMPFEISAAEGKSMDRPEKLPVKVSLRPVQLAGPEQIPLLPVRYQIAQKLHACTEDLTGTDRRNDRARDLHDLLLIRELAVSPNDLPSVRQACLEIFNGRQKHPWPPRIVVWDDWPSVWQDLARREESAMTLDEAVREVQRFVDDIDNAKPGKQLPD